MENEEHCEMFFDKNKIRVHDASFLKIQQKKRISKIELAKNHHSARNVRRIPLDYFNPVPEIDRQKKLKIAIICEKQLGVCSLTFGGSDGITKGEDNQFPISRTNHSMVFHSNAVLKIQTQQREFFSSQTPSLSGVGR